MRRDDDELLLSYLLDGLSEPERREVDARLADEPDLAQRLEQLRQCLEHSERDEADCPKGLADRTADSIHGAVVCPVASRLSVSAGEIGAIAFVCLLLFCCALPAMVANRESARRLTCENNFRELSSVLRQFAADHGGYFPGVAADQHAGAFVLALTNNQYIDRQLIRGVVVCPSSDMANRVSMCELSVRVPTDDELRVAHDPLVARLERIMAGSMTYSFGHLNPQGVYAAKQGQGDCRRPLLSEAPPRGSECGGVHNHGQCGQNVLFRDGSLSFVVGPYLPMTKDHMFLNREGEVAAGVDWCDSVLASSWARPLASPPAAHAPQTAESR